MVTRAFAALLLIGTLAGCAPRASGVEFDVTPQSALVDAPVTLSVKGLQAGSTVQISAQAHDAQGETWRSEARFVVPAGGTVSSDETSRGGTYTGRDAMGLFETMRPPPGTRGHFVAPAAGFDVHLAATGDGSVLGTATVHRIAPAGAGVRSRTLTVAADGVQGTLYLPATTKRRMPAVLFFGGSEGGESRDFGAATTAAHGYATLSLAYFDTPYYTAPGLPEGLESVPMEYFVSALRILAAQHGVDPQKIVVFGASRGTEMAQLLALHHPELVHALVLGSPTDHVNVGIPDESRPAWTIGGSPVTSAPADRRLVADPRGSAPGTLPIGRFAGRVLTICGEKDEVWPSCSFASSIRVRRTAAGRSDDMSVALPDAGHAVDNADAYYSASPGVGDVTPQAQMDADLAASATARAAVLRFLGSQ